MKQRLYDLMDWEAIEAIVYSEEDHPQRVLGPQKVKGGILVQVFVPGAVKAKLRLKSTGRNYTMDQSDDAGMFAVLLPGKTITEYTIIASYEDGSKVELEDPYLYQDLFGANHIERFEKGIHREIYRYMGAHPAAVRGCMDDTDILWDVTEDAVKDDAALLYGTHFAVWAPNAMRVSVVGDFNGWDGRRHPMMRQGDSGVFSLFIPGIGPGELYKYEIKSAPQKVTMKTDPYGFACEKRPANASIVTNLQEYRWNDDKWLAKRSKRDYTKEPMNIYEVHLGSWKRQQGTEDGFVNYRELARQLVQYVQEMGYTHVELLPVMEHPLDESWGYQVTSYYAPTSRHGSPQDFMYFMDTMHQAGIGVILDWVPAHFPKDENGLARFDGTCLYEHADPRQGEHPHWGTLIYNYGRPEVANFLTANALFWIEQYHADGIRMDAVASMLYLDYGKQDGEWVANMYGGNENLEAIAFLRDLSDVMHERNKGALLIAEESTAWPKVTEPSTVDGLGFDLKWNMGWMNDFTTYMQTDPLFRKDRHGMLTFSMIYAYSEKFVLVFSHDEVVHLKGSMFAKMPGEPEEKYANLRVAYGFMMAHPGKKLLFMGQEFAQETEWNEKQELPWEQAEEPDHRALQQYVKALNTFYQEHPAWYETDFDAEGFEWLSSMDADHSIITFMRYDAKKEERLLVVCNFTPVTYENFKIGVPVAGKYKEIFNSDQISFGGTGCINARQKSAKKIPWDGREYSLTISVPPLGMSVYRCVLTDTTTATVPSKRGSARTGKTVKKRK